MQDKTKSSTGNCLHWWRKLEQSFPNAQFDLENDQLHPFWEDRNSSGSVKLIYVKQVLIAKQLESFETRSAESICNKLVFQIKSAFFLHIYSKKEQSPALTKSFKQSLSSCWLKWIDARMLEYWDVIAENLSPNLLDPKSDLHNLFSDLRDT